MKNIIIIFFLTMLLVACKNERKEQAITEPEIVEETIDTTTFDVIPISHATMILEMGGTVIYVDPVGGAAAFADQPEPDLILITDIHGDHFNLETLEAVNTAETKIFVPMAVAEKLPEFMQAQVAVVSNGDSKDAFEMMIEAIPMYNLRKEALKFHEKGRGNGYVINKNGYRVYISGDTEDIPEMRQLDSIDVAFVCMNLPYTMTVESAADAVLDFKPEKVYPYHYRGTEGLSEVEKFKRLVNAANDSVEVIQLDWYPEQ
jgi:L-ascorbate metabolism protein UlaG (beta-lactamase superfamily)